MAEEGPGKAAREDLCRQTARHELPRVIMCIKALEELDGKR